jgi:hypothetical protein
MPSKVRIIYQSNAGNVLSGAEAYNALSADFARTYYGTVPTSISKKPRWEVAQWMADHLGPFPGFQSNRGAQFGKRLMIYRDRPHLKTTKSAYKETVKQLGIRAPMRTQEQRRRLPTEQILANLSRPAWNVVETRETALFTAGNPLIRNSNTTTPAIRRAARPPVEVTTVFEQNARRAEEQRRPRNTARVFDEVVEVVDPLFRALNEELLRPSNE